MRTFVPSSQANSRYFNGNFEEYHEPLKYYGHRPIKFRSSYEFRYMCKLELSVPVVKWSSEEIRIPYFMKEKVGGKFVLRRHEYVTDFTVHMESGKKYVVEVKPASQRPQPANIALIKRDPVLYKNACKWRAAIIWCKANGYEFKVESEANLFGKGEKIINKGKQLKQQKGKR
jgi:hypothetical protein